MPCWQDKIVKSLGDKIVFLFDVHGCMLNDNLKSVFYVVGLLLKKTKSICSKVYFLLNNIVSYYTRIDKNDNIIVWSKMQLDWALGFEKIKNNQGKL
jgi:hypothetical protein